MIWRVSPSKFFNNTMDGTLQHIEITDDIVYKLAAIRYKELCTGQDLYQQIDYIIGIWHDNVVEDLETFNELVDMFKDAHITCRVENCGCGWDVEDYYKE